MVGRAWCSGDTVETANLGDASMESQATGRQAEILEIIRSYVADNGRPPSRPELAKMLGIASTNGVFKHLDALAKKGAIELVPKAARGIRVLELGLPLVGRVAAGSPILAIENMLGRYPVDPNLLIRAPTTCCR